MDGGRERQRYISAKGMSLLMPKRGLKLIHHTSLQIYGTPEVVLQEMTAHRRVHAGNWRVQERARELDIC